MNTKEENVRLSKLLSYVLRHNPAHLGIQLDHSGWTNVKGLTFVYKDENERKGFELLKLREQIVDIIDKG